MQVISPTGEAEKGSGLESRAEPPLYLESRSHDVTGLKTGWEDDRCEARPTHKVTSKPISLSDKMVLICF